MQKNVPEIKWLIVLLEKEVKNTQKVFQIRKRRNRTIGSYMWRRIIMNTVRMILCGNVEDSRMNPSEKVGVVSVVFVSTEEEKIKNKLKKLQDKNPEKFYMEYVTPLDVDLTSLEHYPSIEISKNDLQ